MIGSEHKLSIKRQCELLGVSRAWYYSKPRLNKERINKENKDKRLIIKILRHYPQYGYRKVSLESRESNKYIKAKRTRRLMSEMGLTAIYPKPNLSKAAKMHKKYPYLLRDIKVSRINQVWSTDITYVKLPCGTVYLTAILDLYSRKVLSWRISNTMDVNFCILAFNEAISKYGCPDIFNTDQGSQFTSEAFISLLKTNNIRISMDGKGRAFDNIFIERLWRTVKYEDIFINNYETLKELKFGLRVYFEFYNKKRFHQSLKYLRPDEVYYKIGNYAKAA